MTSIAPSKKTKNQRPETIPEALRVRRLVRHHRHLGACLDRDDVDAAKRAIVEYQQTHGQPESRLEHYQHLVESLLADPPYLYDGEHEFLKSMARRTSLGLEPTEKQEAWIEKIARRRS